MHQYKLISRKGEGTFSEVLKAQSLKTGNYVAIKCMKTHFNSIEQVNQLREIQALQKVSPHANIVKLLEVLYDEPTGRLALVFELMEMNMYELIKDRKTYLPQNKVKYYMYQVFKAIDQMHRKGVFYRDIKPENILMLGDHVKLADLGSCRGMYGEHPYTEYISTRWYRSPECLMTDGYYDQKMDIWGAGCVMFEMLTLIPLFPGKNELDMIHRIHSILGTPSQKVLDRFQSHASHMEFNFPPKTGTGIDKLLTHVTADCVDLLKQMLIYDPEKRITSTQILQHEYFRELVAADKMKESQTNLTPLIQSPSLNQFQKTLYNDGEKSPTMSTTSQKTTTINSPKKKPTKKLANAHSTMHKFPALKVNLKLEGSLKSSYLNDTSTEEEGDKGGMLPPLKQQISSINLETKVALSDPYQSSKRKNETKNLTSTFIKSSVANQYMSKKPSKNSMYQGADYLVVGRKAC